MFGYLGAYSDSFLLAVLAWPFAAALLTVPAFIIQYRRYNRVVWRRIGGVYLIILYVLALATFTLYPLPDNPAAFCRDYHLAPRLNPIGIITDIQTEGMRAVLQIAMNLVFFIPLGIFGRLFFRWRFRTLVVASLATSLFIETAQLTGGFWLYPCSYRLFDTGDLIVNTLGGVVGYLVAALIPSRELQLAEKHDYVHTPGLLRQVIAFMVDSIASGLIAVFVSIGLYFIIGKDTAMHSGAYIHSAVIGAVFGLLPYIRRGTSPGGYFTRLNHDDKNRTGLSRVLYYASRAAIAWLLIVSTGWLPFITSAVTLIVWLKWKKLPHQFVG